MHVADGIEADNIKLASGKAIANSAISHDDPCNFTAAQLPTESVLAVSPMAGLGQYILFSNYHELRNKFNYEL